MSRLHRSNLARTAFTTDEERLQTFRKRFRASQFTRYVTRPMLLSLLVLSLMLGIVSILTEIKRDEPWSALIGLLFLVALEAIYTTNWLHHPDRLRLNRTAYRAAELLLILIVVRITSWAIFEGGFPDAAQLQDFIGDPLLVFLNFPFLASLMLAMVAWRLAVILSKIFNRLEISEFELRFYSMPPAIRKELAEDQPIQTGRSGLVQSFARIWIWGGILLVVIVGLISLDISSIDSFKNPLVMGPSTLQPNLLVLLLLYFGLGLWMLSHAKFMEMNARWLVNGISSEDCVERNWQRYSLLILLTVSFVAAFLPIGPTLAISRIIGVGIYIVLFIVNILIFLVSLPFALILALISRMPMEEIEPLTPIAPPNLTENIPPTVSPLGEGISLVLSSAFWSVFMVVLLLAFVFFLRERKSTVQEISPATLWYHALAWLTKLWQRMHHRARAVRRRIPIHPARKNKSEQNSQEKKRWRFVRIGGLPPREQIRYFYLSTVRRAGERGVQRGLAQTPIEYAENLKGGWPTVEQEVEELTEAFLKARYSEDPIASSDIPEVKETWKDLRNQIRKQPSPSDSDPEQKSTTGKTNDS